MKSLRLVGLLIGMLILSSTYVFAAGEAGGAFLKIGVGARASGMGDAFCAVSDDVTCLHWNPGGLGQLDRIEASTTYVSWLEGIKLGFVGYTQPFLEDDQLGLSIVYLGTGPIDGYEDELGGGKKTQYNAFSFALGLTYGAELNKDLFLGLTVKYVHEKIENNNTNSLTFDLGGLYRTPIPNLDVGVSVVNAGSKGKFIKETFDLPLTYRIGLSYRAFAGCMLAALDFCKPVDNKWRVNAGLECWIGGTIALRVGYDSQIYQDGGPGFTAGVGFKRGPYRIDYSCVSYSKDMDETHKVSLTVRLK